MDDPLGAPLDAADGDHQARAHHNLAVALEHLGQDHEVGHPGLVLDGHEADHPRPRPLAHQHHPRAGDGDGVGHGGDLGAARHPLGGEALAQEAHGVALQRQAGGLVVGHHMLGKRHGRQGERRLVHGGLLHQRGGRGLGHRLHLPQRPAPVEAEAAEGVGLGELLQLRPRQAGAADQGREIAEPRPPRRDQLVRPGLGDAADLPEPQPERRPGFPRLQGAVPVAVFDVDRAHLHPMLAGVAHDLGRGVEAHGL